MKIAKYISELLFEHEKVIIPGLGAFFSEASSAQINQKDKSISPPQKKIRFNPALRIDDNLLTNHISSVENIPLKEAKTAIEDFVKTCIDETNQGKKIKLIDIGVLYKDSNEKMAFIPESNKNYDLNTFGMSDVNTPPSKKTNEDQEKTPPPPPLKPADRNKDKPSPTVKVKNEKETKNKKKKKRIPVLLWILLIILPFIIFLITLKVLNPVYFDSQYNKYSQKAIALKNKVFPPDTLSSNQPQIEQSDTSAISGTNPDKQVLPDQNKREEESDMYTDSESPDKTNAYQDNTQYSQQQNETKTPQKSRSTTQTNYNAGDNYYLIAGSFREKSNASNLVHKLQGKGFPSIIVGQTNSGLYMVSYRGYDNLDEAKKEFYKIKLEENIDSWIYFNR